ncbi:helix-turn-helix domain-containing protein [Streptomyces sp. MBT33]|uniref:helix-turn-helix domain-containing protein n=1 Tax=Streptomyces sp. MBT33 TaxID=1488363 RepID=UPI00190A3330|nr:AraC family transcriptional regulator [Streptomyces sp. MBT33]MBK3641436.1 helix-turn-helix transcriptional regulator [Streptomyces sp. MBT33]
MDATVRAAIACMHERFGGPLTVTDIAGNAALSRFDFSRLFKEETGVSPGEFLDAVRVGEARKLLDATSMSITEISRAVGYAGPDAFTDSFTARVGLSPGRFRRLCREEGEVPPLPRQDPDPAPGPEHGSLAGTVRLPPGHGNARVFLGAFATAVVQYPALAWTIVDVPSDRPSCYSLHHVPAGRRHLLAVAVAAGTGHDPQAVRTALLGGAAAAVTVTAGAVTSAAVRLRAARRADPPVLLALPRLEPPAAVVPHPGCAAAADPTGPGGAVRLRVVPAAPARSGA